MPIIVNTPITMKIIMVATLMSDNQNSVSPKAFTENILSKKRMTRKMMLQVTGLKKLEEIPIINYTRRNNNIDTCN